MKYRLPDGRQVQRRLGPAWTGRGRPPTGYFTKRLAGDELQAVLDQARRIGWGEDDLVFCGETGGYLDGSALRRRYKLALAAAGLRQLRVHDLRHTVRDADDRQGRQPPVQEWMGHADIQTTMRYLHYAPRQEDARLVAEAFALDSAAASTRTSSDVLGTSSRTSAASLEAEKPLGAGR